MAGMRALSIGLMATVIVVTGCRSGQDEEAQPTIGSITEEMIRTDVASQAGLGELTPLCPQVDAPTVGTMYECTATTEDQRIVSLTATINDEGKIALATNNMITAAALPSFERRAAEALNAEVGSRLQDDSIDCGEEPVIFGQDNVMVCALEDPLTQGILDVSFTITDIEDRQFSLVVADTPRP